MGNSAKSSGQSCRKLLLLSGWLMSQISLRGNSQHLLFFQLSLFIWQWIIAKLFITSSSGKLKSLFVWKLSFGLCWKIVSWLEMFSMQRPTLWKNASCVAKMNPLLICSCNVWNVVSRALGIYCHFVGIEQCINVRMRNYGQSKRNLATVGVGVIFWGIWKTRNTACFQNKWPAEHVSVIYNICHWIQTWSSMNVRPDTKRKLTLCTRVLEWVATDIFQCEGSWAQWIPKIGLWFVSYGMCGDRDQLSRSFFVIFFFMSLFPPPAGDEM